MKNKIYEYVHTHTVNLLRSIVQDGRGVRETDVTRISDPAEQYDMTGDEYVLYKKLRQTEQDCIRFQEEELRKVVHIASVLFLQTESHPLGKVRRALPDTAGFGEYADALICELRSMADRAKRGKEFFKEAEDDIVELKREYAQFGLEMQQYVLRAVKERPDYTEGYEDAGADPVKAYRQGYEDGQKAFCKMIKMIGSAGFVLLSDDGGAVMYFD